MPIDVDGRISFPLIGTVDVAGRAPSHARTAWACDGRPVIVNLRIVYRDETLQVNFRYVADGQADSHSLGPKHDAPKHVHGCCRAARIIA